MEKILNDCFSGLPLGYKVGLPGNYFELPRKTICYVSNNALPILGLALSIIGIIGVI